MLVEFSPDIVLIYLCKLYPIGVSVVEQDRSPGTVINGFEPRYYIVFRLILEVCYRRFPARLYHVAIVFVCAIVHSAVCLLAI